MRPDAKHHALEWKLRLAEPHGIRRLRFGSVTADLLYDGAGTVTVHTEQPFALTLGARHFVIMPGDTRIQDGIPLP